VSGVLYLAEAKPSKHEVVACRAQREDPDQVQAATERVKAMERAHPIRRETINWKGYACKP